MAQPDEKEEEVSGQSKAAGYMTVLEHLEELRWRIIWSVVALVIGTAISFSFSDDILRFLTAPVPNLVFLRPSEAFLAHLRIAFIVGAFMASPVIVYQAVLFIRPALTASEARYFYALMPAILGLFALGIVFAYVVMIPILFKFFLGFGSDIIQPFITVDSYISFLINTVLPFGFVFELPVAVFMCTRMGIITPEFLTKNRKYAALVMFVLAAILTPPDVASQLLMAGPMLALYEVSIWVSKLSIKQSSAASRRASDDFNKQSE